MEEKISKILGYGLDILHLFGIFFPVTVYFINYPLDFVTFMFLISSLISLSWIFFDNKCVLTVVSKNLRESNNDKNFSQEYLAWFYDFIIKIFNLEKSKNALDKAINIHWMFNLIILWYYLFYYKYRLRRR